MHTAFSPKLTGVATSFQCTKHCNRKSLAICHCQSQIAKIPTERTVFRLGNRSLKSQSLAICHRTVKLQCGIAKPCLRNRAILGVRDSNRNRNRKSQKSRDCTSIYAWSTDCQTATFALSTARAWLGMGMVGWRDMVPSNLGSMNFLFWFTSWSSQRQALFSNKSFFCVLFFPFIWLWVINTLFLQIGFPMSSLFSGTDCISLR